jgi:hypothetical protein
MNKDRRFIARLRLLYTASTDNKISLPFISGGVTTYGKGIKGVCIGSGDQEVKI